MKLLPVSNIANAVKCIHVLADHKHYVQGVAWDPLSNYIATQSSDRYSLHSYRTVQMYTYQIQKPGSLVTRNIATHTKLDLAKHLPRTSSTCSDMDAEVCEVGNPMDNVNSMQPPPPSPIRAQNSQPPSPKPLNASMKKIKMYHDEDLTSFFRRLTFTPDGSLLLTPGIHSNNSSRTV